MPRQINAATSASASALGVRRPFASQNWADCPAAPTRPDAEQLGLVQAQAVSETTVSVTAAIQPCSTRSTRCRTAGSLRRSDSKTSRNASLS